MINTLSHEILELIGDIYDCAMSGDWNKLLEKIRVVTNSNKAFFILWNATKNQMVKYEMVTNFSYDSSLIETYQNRFSEDPWHRYSQLIIEGEVTNYSEVIPISEIEHLSIYKDIFVPMKSYHCLGAIVVRDGTHDGYVALNRGADEESYKHEDVQLLEVITPHLIRAAKIYTELIFYNDKVRFLDAISESSASGVVVCDINGFIISINKLANNLIVLNSNFIHDPRFLRLNLPYLNSKLLALIERCCTPFIEDVNVGGYIFLDGDEAIFITASPIKSEYFDLALDRRFCLITMMSTPSLNWAALAQEYDFTLREVELLKLMYERKSMADIVALMDIKLNTVRTHCQNIYRKMNVSTQMELMAKLSLFNRG
ncbi:helix-turn-helix transcriptional regulator [Agarivorans sp. JK6]|uniref:helix-turn-helix transcriptional regulator n=1 Tax=Agarivorans sp. JK6 TaxID=2997426 RepID=UPI003872AD14